MNAAETIQAAIDALESERDTAALGPWYREYGDVVTGRADPDDQSDEPASERVVRSAHSLRAIQGIANADLIVTLHRTIDAQLAILRAAIEHHIDNRQKLWTVALDLANAILGEVTPDA